MPRYYFHLECDGRIVPDETGAELRDADQACAAARASARNLMGMETEAGVDWLSCSFSVTDDTGEIVLEVPFIEVAEEDAQEHLN